MMPTHNNTKALNTQALNTQVSSPKVLCVDLDGTLTPTDMLLECFVRAIKKNPFIIFLLPFWLRQGKGVLKYELYKRAMIDIKRIPFDKAVLDFLQKEKAKGREIILVSGAYHELVRSLALRLPLFSAAYGSTKHENLTGKHKAKKLIALYGEQGFDYIGNEFKDLAVWQHCDQALIANVRPALLKRLSAKVSFAHIFTPTPPGIKVYAKAMRLHQWVKNLLLYVPLITSHTYLFDMQMLYCTIAFICFGLFASGTYIINDLLDLDSDRRHSTKRMRPFAATQLSIKDGLLLIFGLLCSSSILMILLPPAFAITLLVYFVTTLAYSFILKQIAVVDVITLACLYTVRVVAGGIAAGVSLSFWLLAFSMFVFLGLSMVKRVSEIINVEATAHSRVHGRGYTINDKNILFSMGSSSSYLSVLVLAFYINSPDIAMLYDNPRWLWLLCPLFLFWVTRIWLVTARGQMNEDPILYAVKDTLSWGVALVAISIMFIATFH